MISTKSSYRHGKISKHFRVNHVNSCNTADI